MRSTCANKTRVIVLFRNMSSRECRKNIQRAFMIRTRWDRAQTLKTSATGRRHTSRRHRFARCFSSTVRHDLFVVWPQERRTKTSARSCGVESTRARDSLHLQERWIGILKAAITATTTALRTRCAVLDQQLGEHRSVWTSVNVSGALLQATPFQGVAHAWRRRAAICLAT
jgi:hypothetical protein